MLYPLYVLSEIAIISTDLAELLGSAIALCLLFPSLPLWAGVPGVRVEQYLVEHARISITYATHEQVELMYLPSTISELGGLRDFGLRLSFTTAQP